MGARKPKQGMTPEERALYQSVGEWLKDARLKRGWTQKQLGKKAKVSAPSVCNIEAGKQKFRFDVLYKLCEVLGLEPREILPTIAELKAKPQKKVPVRTSRERWAFEELVAKFDEMIDESEKKS